MGKAQREKKRLRKKVKTKLEWKREQESNHSQEVDHRLNQLKQASGFGEPGWFNQNEKRIKEFQRVQGMRNKASGRKKTSSISK